MNFIRNTFAVILGLAVSVMVITFGAKINPTWVTYKEFFPFGHWLRFLESIQHNQPFFLMLLFSSGLGAMIGGVVTALIVQCGKVAYAMFIGFILLFAAMLDIILFPYHPTFYKVGIFLTYFPFSWLGGKIVEILHLKKNRRTKKNPSQN